MCTQPSLGWCVFFLRSIFFVRFFVIHAASFPLLRFVPFHIASSFCPTRVGMRMQVTTHLVLVLRNCLMMTLVFTSFHPCTIHLHAIHPCLLVMHSSSWHGSLSTCSIVVHGFHRGPHGCCRSTSIPCRAHVALVSSIQSASLRRAFDHTRYVNPWQRGRKEGRKEDADVLLSTWMKERLTRRMDGGDGGDTRANADETKHKWDGRDRTKD